MGILDRVIKRTTNKLVRVNLSISSIQNFITERNYKSYLELGVCQNYAFNGVNCEYKVGVDIKYPATYTMSTDEFFAQNTEKFDIIYIDADHREVQLTKDIENSLLILNENGVILCHDCNPPCEEYQIDERMLWQTAWKAFSRYRIISPYKTYCINDGYGIGVIDTMYPADKVVSIPGIDYENLKYTDLQKHRTKILGLSGKDLSSILD